VSPKKQRGERVADNGILTNGMTTEQIIEFAVTRPEFPWRWGCFTHGEKGQLLERAAADLAVSLQRGAPIRPGDMYFGIRNTGPKLLTCRELGEACVFPIENGYAFDFSECVKIEQIKQE
jgi:hypothetical protein